MSRAAWRRCSRRSTSTPPTVPSRGPSWPRGTSRPRGGRCCTALPGSSSFTTATTTDASPSPSTSGLAGRGGSTIITQPMMEWDGGRRSTSMHLIWIAMDS
uniref:Uncharacterized protein n=1 Tax=Arundo donax TaxID=35708 RepID=A0A0A9CU70_ARUDO